MAALDNALEKTRTAPPASDVNALAAAIDDASDDEVRQQAIKRYVDVVQVLDPDVQPEAMNRLDALHDR